jgi:outer membrane receptor for ferrienterochelin and colicins
MIAARRKQAVVLGLLVAAGALPAGSVWGGEQARPDEAESLLTVIRYLQSDIATRAVVQDTDEAPGLVQVFRREDLEARGVRTVAEALDQVAGVDVPIDNLGVRQPVIRGFGGILSGATGKLKYLLNGVTLNSTQSATGSAFLEIPISQIERIDIIRGPGSAVYGENAFLGVVNVITRNEGRNLYLRYGSDDTLTAGGLWSHTTPSGTNVSFSASGWQTDGADSHVDTDPLFAIGQAGISNAPGPANEYRDDRTAILQVNKGGFSFLAQYLESGQGDHFGALYLPSAGSREVFSNRWWTAEANYVSTPGPESEWRFKAGWERFRNRFDDVELSPPGFFGIYPDGQEASTHYEEEKGYAGVEFVFSGLDRQTWLAGVEYSSVNNFNSYSEQNFDTENLIPGTPFPAPLPVRRRFNTILDEGQTRRIGSLYVQDLIDFTERFALTAGARIDNYSDAGDAFTPRLAGVYRINGRNIVKAQYAEAFRPPTFVELYSTADAARGDRELEPETVRTAELSYIHKTPSTVLRATLFQSDFKDLIVSENRQFLNAGGARARGVDLELERQFTRRFKLTANLSYADTEDDETGRPLEGSADYIASIDLVYQPTLDWSIDVLYRYVDDRHRAPSDPRKDLEGYATTGVTVSRFDLAREGLTVRFGVHNLFDEEVTNPAPANTYAGDYPRPGRTWFMHVSVDF